MFQRKRRKQDGQRDTRHGRRRKWAVVKKDVEDEEGVRSVFANREEVVVCRGPNQFRGAALECNSRIKVSK